MTSSGMKRGLAVVAVSALGVTGLPLLAGAANAVPLSAQTGAADVVLATGSGMSATPAVSVANDGVNTTAHLVAIAKDTVSKVQFSYIPQGGTTADAKTIESPVALSNGVFSLEWTVPAAIYNTHITLQAQGLDTKGANVGAVASTPNVLVSPNASSVDIANAAGSTINVFKAPYTAESKDGLFGVVSGTTSDTGNVTVDGVALQGARYGDPANGIRTFSGVANFGSYNFSTDGKADQAVVNATVAGSDDNEGVVLKNQTITDVTAVAKNANPAASSPTTPVTVTVLDQDKQPVIGAQVVDTTTGGETKYTDANGQAVFTATGNAAGMTTTYLVNTTDDAGYDAQKDFERDVKVTTYADSAASIAGVASDLGSALDFNEYSKHPVKVQVNDNKSAAEAGQTVQYSWTLVPTAAPHTPVDVTPVANTVTTGPDGTIAVPAPTGNVPGVYTLNAYQELDKSPGQSAGDLKMAPLSVTMGNAAVTYTDGGVAQGLAGTSKTFTAKLALADGTPLPGRTINLGYTEGTQSDSTPGNAAFSAAQPAGTTVKDGVASAKTDAAGLVSVSVTDPAAAKPADQLSETGDGLHASDTDSTFSPAALEVDWLKSLTADHISWGDQADLLGDATPGRPVSQGFTVFNKDGQALTDQTFSLTTDNDSFFTPQVDDTKQAANSGDLVADPAPAKDGQYGDWKSSGKTIQVTTDDLGKAYYTTAVDRMAALDNTGSADSVVTVAGVPNTNTDKVTWESGTPLNPGTLSIELSTDQTVSSSVLPKAPTTENVNMDVVATDQFGNRVAVPVTVTDGSSTAKVADSNGTAVSGPVTSQFIQDKGLVLSSDDATSQSLSGKWANAGTKVYGDNPGTTDKVETDYVVSGTKDVTADSPAIDWYKIDYSASKYGMTHTGAATQSVGSVVTETYKAVDQNGEPIKGISVTFFRSGPDDLQDGSGKGGDTTDNQGEVSYTYQGAKAGKAVTSAIASLANDTDGWTRFPGGDASDTVAFGSAAPKQVHIHPSLGLSNQKNGADVATVNGPTSAHGAMVKLYKVVNGHRHLVVSKHADKSGNARFVVADAHRGARTTYVAYVGATSRTFSAWTPKSSIK